MVLFMGCLIEHSLQDAIEVLPHHLNSQLMQNHAKGFVIV